MKTSLLEVRPIYHYLEDRIYPLLINETCFFLAVDFDEESWRDDVLAFQKLCQDANILAGMGGILYFLFLLR